MRIFLIAGKLIQQVRHRVFLFLWTEYCSSAAIKWTGEKEKRYRVVFLCTLSRRLTKKKSL